MNSTHETLYIYIYLYIQYISILDDIGTILPGRVGKNMQHIQSRCKKLNLKPRGYGGFSTLTFVERSLAPKSG